MIAALAVIPFLGAGILLCIPSQDERSLKMAALAACGFPFLITLLMLARFHSSLPGYQFQVWLDWLPALGISYHLGVDGINLTLCLLHALVSFAGAFVATSEKQRLKEYLFFYLVLVGSIYGVFTSLDLFFLYLFYETALIPLYPMIAVWGSENKEYGAMKLTLFITAGAVLGLFGILMLYRQIGGQTFDLIQLQEITRAHPLPEDFQNFAAGFVLIGFGVIASLWPLHSWSPIGYAAAPTSVSMLHAGVLKKMGPYLILRIALTILPQGFLRWSDLLAILGVIGILYAGYAAVTQKDLKFMVGFSSVSHMGYVLLGLAAMTPAAISGAVFLMFSHGVMAAALFALIGFLYAQAHTRGVSDFGGLAKNLPFVSTCFLMAALASLGLPGFSNFVSELLVFLGSWTRYPVPILLAVCGILITSLYLLRAVQKIFFGPLHPAWANLKDATGFYERFPLILLIASLVLFGFYPQGLLRIIQPAVSSLGVLP